MCVLVVDVDLEVDPKDKDRSSSDQRKLMLKDKLDADDDDDGSFDSSDTVSAPSFAVVVAISDVLVVCIACQSNSPLLCFVGQRASA